MCGIVGYVGPRSAQPILQAALAKLEYRGYDSCGIAVTGEQMVVHKRSGRVAEMIASAPIISGKAGVGHTRWASCGSPNVENAHPHLDCSGRIAVVHNGNITNYLGLKNALESRGHVFLSGTDSEVIVHLIEEEYKGDVAEALASAVRQLEGTYAIVAIHQGEPRLAVVRRGSALVIGLGDGENWVASDVNAFAEYTGRVIYLNDGDLAVIEKESVVIKNKNRPIERRIDLIEWRPDHIEKSGYEHFMLKEIHEQPGILRKNIGIWLKTGLDPKLNGLWDKIHQPPLVVGCGSSYYAGLTARYFMEELTGQPIQVELASELSHRPGTPVSRPLVIGLTQSGETADTLSTLNRLGQAGAGVIAVTNVSGSSVTRLADQTMLLGVGPEISVAATKTFTAQLVSLYALTLSTHGNGGNVGFESRLKELPGLLQRMLDDTDDLVDAARWLAGYSNIICIGRGPHYPVAMEAALKLKEVAYIHAEGYAAGELKHGPLALLDTHTPVVALFGARDDTWEMMLTAVREVKVRGAPVLALVPDDDPDIKQLADRVILMPRASRCFQPVITAVAVQLLAYHAARSLGYPIDTPRHLAKSVTVE
ncbi:MAG: glutamine--fructose-6-phosphate transaminase (isomerizing) [Dehalogenimonas sp.]